MKNFILTAALAVAMLVSCNNDGGEKPSDVKENPNPTTIGNVWLVRSGLAVDPDGFNMLTDGGFERFIGDEEWASKSLWYLPEWISEAATAYSGSRTLYADCNTDGWRDVAVQSVCLKKNNSYTLTLNFRGAWDGLNVYMGFRGAEVHDMNTNTDDVGTEWKEYSYTLNNVDDVKVDAFLGGWCWYDLWLEADDFKVVPTGTNNDSFMPQGAQVVGTSITNASFNDVKSVEKTVAWVEPDGRIAVVLHNAATDDGVSGNLFGVSDGKGVANGLKLVSVSDNSVCTTENFVPTGGVTVGSARYLHYYVYAGYAVPADEDADEDSEDPAEPDWTVSESGVLCSADGKTWEAAANGWNPDGNFVKVSYLQRDDYVYVFGSAAGDKSVKTYVARVKGDSVGNAAAYEYWDGYEWVAGDEDAAAPVCYGPADEMSVVYNASLYTYMMVYRSATTGGLVYRDAGLPEGEWSGEKVLMTDPDAQTALYAPQVIAVDGSSLTMLASKRL